MVRPQPCFGMIGNRPCALDADELIPEFNEHGYLPLGIHPATLYEIEQRFGLEPEVRRAELQSLKWLVDLVRRVGVQRLIINGSFVTDTWEPNDVDCALLIPHAFPGYKEFERELIDGFPFLHIDVVTQEELDQLTSRVFAMDREAEPKGMIEVMLWS